MRNEVNRKLLILKNIFYLKIMMVSHQDSKSALAENGIHLRQGVKDNIYI